MGRIRSVTPALVVMAALLPMTVACESDSDSSSEPAASDQPAGSAQLDPSVPVGVDRLGVEDPGGFDRAPVPADALPSVAVEIEPDDDDVVALVESFVVDGQFVVPVTIQSCSLIAVWALPRPDGLLVGWEDHPMIDCAQAVTRLVVFVIAESGENSEGRWSYETAPTVTIEQQRA